MSVSEIATWFTATLLNWFRFLLAGIKGVGKWVKKPSMNKLMVILFIGAAYTFWRSWTDLSEMSAIPLAWLLSSSLCGAFYLVDRVGFAKVDTISLLNNHPRIYAIYMALYAGLLLAGHVLALLVFAQ